MNQLQHSLVRNWRFLQRLLVGDFVPAVPAPALRRRRVIRIGALTGTVVRIWFRLHASIL